MSQRKDHLAEISSGEVTDALASVMGEESPLITWNRRVGRMKVNGVPLAEQHARFKRPDDVIFHKQTHEALMGADIIAGLDLDDEIVDITSRDNPDLILHFNDGSKVYADFTRACVDLDEANAEAVRAVNRRLMTELLANLPVDFNSKSAFPQITLRVRSSDRLNQKSLYDEALTWIRTPANQNALPGPLMTSLGATFCWYDLDYGVDDNAIVQMFESRDLVSLIQTVRKRIADKIGRYSQRPLWLLVSISESWANSMGDGAYIDFIEAARDGSLTFDLGEFDRIAVGVRGSAVFLRDRKDGDDDHIRC